VDEASRASFEKTLVDEQMQRVLGSRLRGFAALALLLNCSAMAWLGESPLARALLPITAFFVVYSVGINLARRLGRRPLQLFYVTPILDVPVAGVVGFVWGGVPGQSTDWACGVTLAFCLFLVASLAIMLHRRVLVATTATSAAVTMGLFSYYHQPPTRLVLALLIIGLTGAASGSVIRYAVTFVRRSWELADARVRDVEERNREVNALNEELRRQVAERSRELSEALARSEGTLAPAALEVGDVFDGRYRVARPLGRGGMGAVYEVERMRDGRKLALKVVTAALQAKQAARFAREAEIGARLQHENLVSIVDVGVAAGATPFLVMELVQGGSLEDKRARFGDAKWAMPILRQIAAGLAELHANRVVHRDLKPGNVLLVENGGASPPVAKISDFGISRFGAFDDSGDVDAEGATAHPGAAHASPRDLTETGALMGTPVYMPPEAWFGPARHPSADVFSLGVLAYEALTGRSPFVVPPVLLVRSRQPIPTPAPLDGIDPEVASVVLACLHVEASERPRAGDVVLALAAG